MKFKKSVIALALVVLIFGVASVCASDINDTAMASEDGSAIELSQEDADKISADENELIGQTGNNGPVGETDDGTFQALEKKITAGYGSTIILENNYKYEGNGYPEGVTISQSITIDGNGHTIDAKGQARIFHVTANDVTLKNIIFTNGNSTDNGGAVCFDSFINLTVTNCNFTNNKATGDYTCGGAVYFISEGNVTNCNFVNNSAGDGGAIRMTSGIVTNCNFVNNSAGDGGAVSISFGNVSYCNFVGNSALQNYGGIIFMDVSSVSNCNFVGNSAKNTGIIFIHSTVNNYESTVINCIFLNNYEIPIGFKQESSNSNFNYNWVGVNADNYWANYELPTMDGWLFLNATANPDTIYSSDVSNITFKLYMYNSTSRKIFEYDNTLLYPVNLTITATNGNVDKKTAKLGEPITFTPTVGGTGSVTASIENAIYTIKLNILKFNSTLTVGDMVFDYNSTGSTTVDFTNATGVVANVVDHPEAIVKVEDKTITVSNLAGGNYTLNVTTIVDKEHTPVTKTAKITVNKLSTAISLANETLDLKVNQMDTISANLSPADAGNLVYVSSNESVVMISEDGLFVGVGKGTATITVSFAGNENYTAAENRTITVTVTLNDASVSVKNNTLNLKVGERFDLNATSVPHYLNIEYVSSNPSVVSVTDYGIVTAEGEGTAIITVTVGNNITFAFNSTNVTVKVSKIVSKITASAITTVYKVNKDLTVTLKDENGTPISGASVTINLNGAKTYTTDKNGQVKVSTKGFAPKVYTAKITFNGNANFDKSTKSVKVTVKKATPKLTAKKKTFKKSTKTKKYTITLKDNTGKAIKKAKVTLKVNGKTYKATTNSKGKATFKITKLKKKGTYKAVVTYKGNKYYKKISKKVKIKVKNTKKAKKITFKTVSKGSKDKSTVKKIQQALKDNGYYLTYNGRYLKVDGKYEKYTFRSVKEFQHDKGLKVTGKVDEKTAKKLGII